MSEPKTEIEAIADWMETDREFNETLDDLHWQQAYGTESGESACVEKLRSLLAAFRESLNGNHERAEE